MATRNFNKYQYETSPRKLQPEYTPKKNPYKSKKSTAKKIKKKDKSKSKIKVAKRKTVVYILLGFSILFAISYRNAMINEKFSELQETQAKLAEVQKENEQLNVSIESGLNLSNIEQMAKEKLGMQKLESKQKVYVNLPKRDYVETTSEEIILENEEDLGQRIINFFKNIIK